MEHWEFIVGLGIQTVLVLAGGYAMVLRNDWMTKNLKEQLSSMQEELQKLAEVITQQAVQTTRIDTLSAELTMLRRNYEELRRGNGWVTGRRGLDGEYP